MTKKEVILLVVLTVLIVFGLLMFVCWIQLVAFLPMNSAIGFGITAAASSIIYIMDNRK
jgi:hypothetical protein